jgi:large subunit ribosomal protein L15
MWSLGNLPAGPSKNRKRVGRGSGSGLGKTAGRGHKGGKSRSGYRKIGSFEGGQMPLLRRIPKRGFKSIFRKEYSICNVRDLNKFPANTTVDWDFLYKEGVVNKSSDGLKILGDGELKVALTVKAHIFTAGAIKKIEAAGGKAEKIGT